MIKGQITMFDVLNSIQEERKNNIGEKVNAGDHVKAEINRGFVVGTISRVYGLGDSILNIDFEQNGVKYQTAIRRFDVKAIL